MGIYNYWYIYSVIFFFSPYCAPEAQIQIQFLPIREFVRLEETKAETIRCPGAYQRSLRSDCSCGRNHRKSFFRTLTVTE